MWIKANPNPCRQEEPDCVVRAIALATDQSWDTVHWDLCELSHERCTMPSVNWLWAIYLKQNGFDRFNLPDSCPVCMTVKQFCNRYPKGTFVVATGSHAVCVKDGNYLDLWDSGDEIGAYYFRRKQ